MKQRGKASRRTYWFYRDCMTSREFLRPFFLAFCVTLLLLAMLCGFLLVEQAAQQLGAAPHFLYLPALPESLEEKQLLCSTEVYRQIQDQWVQMDTALVNIGNYPSSPDFASLVRYGSLLQQQHTCGRLLVYYFNEAGTVIQSDQDFAIQIPLELLKQCPHIVGVCSANTSEKALRGALRSGIFTHIAARAELVKSLLGQ